MEEIRRWMAPRDGLMESSCISSGGVAASGRTLALGPLCLSCVQLASMPLALVSMKTVGRKHIASALLHPRQGIMASPWTVLSRMESGADKLADRIDSMDSVHREWIRWCGPVRYVCRREKKKRWRRSCLSLSLHAALAVVGWLGGRCVPACSSMGECCTVSIDTTMNQ